VTQQSCDFRQFDHGSAEYRQALELRENVLRAPLGKTLTDADTVGEDQQLHFGLFHQGSLLAAVIIKPLGDGKVILRQMVVALESHGQGIGRRLVNSTEQFLVQRDVREIRLSARESARNFYARLGYQCEGDTFFFLDICHIQMFKMLVETDI